MSERGSGRRRHGAGERRGGSRGERWGGGTMNRLGDESRAGRRVAPTRPPRPSRQGRHGAYAQDDESARRAGYGWEYGYERPVRNAREYEHRGRCARGHEHRGRYARGHERRGRYPREYDARSRYLRECERRARYTPARGTARLEPPRRAGRPRRRGRPSEPRPWRRRHVVPARELPGGRGDERWWHAIGPERRQDYDWAFRAGRPERYGWTGEVGRD